MRLFMRNFAGSFADAAVLFPLLILLGASGQFSPTLLFASAGLAYLLSGFYFRIPMPVQPLKSIAIAGLAIGASAQEIRLSAALLGLSCVLVILFRLDAWMERVPARVVHQVQLGLGVLLLFQATRALGVSDVYSYFAVVLLVGIMLFLPDWMGIPWMGLIAVSGMVYVAVSGFASSVAIQEVKAHNDLRVSIALGLFFPQLALTFANSVLGTRAAVKVYFPKALPLVTTRALLASIGLGNLFMAGIGGLPFCHGSGGLTAHVRGGSNRWWSNFFIGGFLLLLAFQLWLMGSKALGIPVILVSSLLFVTGVHHFRLARETYLQRWGFLRLSAAFLTAVFSQNLLLVLLAAFAMEAAEVAWKKLGPDVSLSRNRRENDFIH